MKHYLPLAIALLLASCGAPIQSSSVSSASSSYDSSSSPSSEELSSSEEPSSSSEEPSSSSEEPASSSEEPSSSSEEPASSSEEPSSASSESSVAPIEKKISLYRATSHLFLTDASGKNNPFLKTYRHKNHEDVPYVDLDEFQHVRRLFDPTLRYHNLTRLADGRYDLAASFGGHCYFDVEKQVVELEDADAYYAEFSDGKVDSFVDPGITYKYLAPSDKTKVLAKGETAVYPLTKYHMEIVEQEGHLYVPFSFASHLLVNPMGNAFAYNGKDFYSSSLLGSQANTVRAYSNDSGFLWAYQDTVDTSAHFNRTAPKEGEAYRFEATVKDVRKQDVKCEAVFASDGKLTIKSDDLFGTVDFGGTWKLEGDVIAAEFVPEGMGRRQTQYIDLSAGGYYRQSERTASMAEATYYQLCMDFDYQYGLKNMLGIESFDAEFERLGHKEALQGRSIETYQDTLAKFLVSGKMGDSHYTPIAEGFSSLHPGVSIGTKYSDYAGERIIRHQEGVARVSQAKSGASLKGTTLNVQGETAVITFTGFLCDYKKEFKGIDAYTVPQGTEDVDAFLTTKMTAHFVEGICYAMNEIKKNDAIKNVCFDVGFNTGGYVMFVPFISAIMTDDPCLVVENSVSRSRTDVHYKADLNGDGVYGGDGDTWKGKYNYYVIQGGGSFSAGNIFPTAAKNGGYATTIGEPTAGGGCGVARRCDITGFFFQYNGYIGFPEKLKDGTYRNSEAGTTPMVEMDMKDVYDLAKLDAKLKQINA